MTTKNERIGKAVEEGKVPVLPFELEIARASLEELVSRQKELGLRFGESMNQSSETWHDNAPAEAVSNESKVVAFSAEKNIKVMHDSELFDYKSDDGTATLGSIVEIEYTNGGGRMKVFLTGVTREAEGFLESDEEIEFVTLSSPMGSAVLGAKVGDETAIAIDKRKIPITIVGIDQYEGN